MNLSKIKNLFVRNINLIASCAAIVSINASLLNNLNKREENNTLENTNIEFNMDRIINTRDEIISSINNNPSVQGFKKAAFVAKLKARRVICELSEKLEENKFVNKYHNPDYVCSLFDSYKVGYDNETDTELDTDKFEITLDNKTYGHLSDEDFELFTAIVASECNGNTHDAMAVASSILNRCDSEKWVSWVDSMNKDGNNPIDQVTLRGQYQVYWSGAYRSNLNGNVPEEVLNACEAVWYDGIRNNEYLCFRSNGSRGYSNNQVVAGGNRFADKLETETEKVLKK